MPYPKRRRKSNPYRNRKKIAHKVWQIGSAPGNNSSVTTFFVNAGNYATTGSALTSIRGALSNKEQECTVGSKIGKTTIVITARGDVGTPGTLDLMVFKRERQSAVPGSGAGLPTDIEMRDEGLQAAWEKEMPGRGIKFFKIPIAPAQPQVRTTVINWDKYNLSTLRAGDWYGITFFNRGLGAGLAVDLEIKYNEWI